MLACLLPVTLEMRLGNAAVSYPRYLGKMLWPAELSPFYPHPGFWPWWAVAGAVAFLGLGGGAAWRKRSRRPWLAWGWLWWLGTLVPTIGLIPTGSHAMADRYTYVSLLGLFTIVAWGLREAVAWRPAWRAPLGVLAALVLAACVWRSAGQIGVWKDGRALCEGIRRVTGEHPDYYRFLAGELALAGRPESEIADAHRRALAMWPGDSITRWNWGGVRCG